MSEARRSIPMQDGSDPSSARLISTLSLAGLFSGLVLVGAYELTHPRIEANKARELREAVFKVLPGVARMQAMIFAGDALRPMEEGETEQELVYAGYSDEDELVGYAIPGEGPGFQDTIRLLYGYLPDQRLIVGMEILESRETPGLGDKIFKDRAFQENFQALAVDPDIVSVKTGTRAAPNEVDTITGATISSQAVVKIINSANQRWLSRLAQPHDASSNTGDPPRGTKSEAGARVPQGSEVAHGMDPRR